jgi:hypothetical protein
MILSDLLDNAVLDSAGEKIGYVIDARFLMDAAPADGSHVGTARLDSLIVSPHARTSFMGYERSDVTAPLFIARFLRWRHRGSCLIQWRDVAQVDRGAVHLRAGYRKEPLTGPNAG